MGCCAGGHHFLHHSYFRKFISHSVVGGRSLVRRLVARNYSSSLQWAEQLDIKRKKSNFLFPFRLKNLLLSRLITSLEIESKETLKSYQTFTLHADFSSSLGCVDWCLPGHKTNAKCHSSFFNTKITYLDKCIMFENYLNILIFASEASYVNFQKTFGCTLLPLVFFWILANSGLFTV